MLVVEEAPAQRQEAHRGQRTLVAAQIQLLGGQLLENELIVRQVSVERVDDVIAEGVGVREAALGGEDVALAVGVAGDVQPVARPALAVLWRRQQSLDDLVKGVGRSIRNERGDFGRRRRQPG